jgi:hypothetical protein
LCIVRNIKFDASALVLAFNEALFRASLLFADTIALKAAQRLRNFAGRFKSHLAVAGCHDANEMGLFPGL